MVGDARDDKTQENAGTVQADRREQASQDELQASDMNWEKAIADRDG